MALADQIILRDTRANQPAAASLTPGALFIVSDEDNIQERTNGTIWEPATPTGGGGSGDVTASGTLTSGSVIVGGGTTVVAATTTGTGVVTALGVNVGSAGAVVVNGGALGTPSSGTLTNATGLPTAGLVNAAVTLAKIQNASANDVLIGSGNSGSGASYAQIALGSGLTMTGTTLSASGGGGGIDMGFTAPVDGDFSWINQGSASTTVGSVWGGTSITLTGPADATIQVRARVKAAPTPPYTVTMAILPVFLNAQYIVCGPVFRQSGDGKLIQLGIGYEAAAGRYPDLLGFRMGSPTSFTSQFTTVQVTAPLSPLWMRIADNSTNRIFSVSADGVTFVPVYSEGRTSFLTADQVGFGFYQQSASVVPLYTLLSWEEA